ncbi:hypothetical protein [Bradyrhizobium sp. SRS-191]|uniref:hypothetical protein n=1 Tax=Bradyrhizobium sp. SRS-191 TaxID=2962606 RepID=UPI00211DF42F|nr:hypothetical protein [Bradyrhizobium sp. SRS-191]
MSEISYSGLCCGGPNDGKLMVNRCPTVNVPVMTHGLYIGQYRHDSKLGIWLWTGEWPPKPKQSPSQNV